MRVLLAARCVGPRHVSSAGPGIAAGRAGKPGRRTLAQFLTNLAATGIDAVITPLPRRRHQWLLQAHNAPTFH
jgi:hypothetical protein